MSDQQNGGGMEPGLVFYQIMKPAAMKDANGNAQYAVIGMTQDIGAAFQALAKTPGGVVTLTICLAKNASSLLTQ